MKRFRCLCVVLCFFKLLCLISTWCCRVIHETFTRTDDSIQLETFSDFFFFNYLLFLCSMSLFVSAAQGALCRWNYLKVSKGDVT